MSIKLGAACPRIAHIYYLPALQIDSIFCSSMPLFRLEFSRGTTAALEIGQAVVEQNLEGKI